MASRHESFRQDREKWQGASGFLQDVQGKRLDHHGTGAHRYLPGMQRVDEILSHLPARHDILQDMLEKCHPFAIAKGKECTRRRVLTTGSWLGEPARPL
jgi:hypothetical protein